MQDDLSFSCSAAVAYPCRRYSKAVQLAYISVQVLSLCTAASAVQRSCFQVCESGHRINER